MVLGKNVKQCLNIRFLNKWKYQGEKELTSSREPVCCSLVPRTVPVPLPATSAPGGLQSSSERLSAIGIRIPTDSIKVSL